MPGDIDATVEIEPDTVEYEWPVERQLPGRYELNPTRVVVEPSIRVLRRPPVRGRFACRGGHLVLGETSELALELVTRSLRTNIFGLARTLTDEGGLCAADNPTIRFRSTDMLIAPDRTLEVVGKLDVLDTSLYLRLDGKLAYADDRAVVVWLTGVLPAPRRQFETGHWIAQVLGERPIHIELAAEFVR
ncbi:YceI family protein [Amycolatopsis sp. K13G38]|uniref:YceI family protein n=1 Tax=Amycolatopsis acididurans TaxID=2724524 RepID=A0ABX1J294_9PSEU|nr:YceI family protein [Amycolatopsis acididurans]NKQ53486.1 YceI family protein [Amycolatopsis acididurans]